MGQAPFLAHAMGQALFAAVTDRLWLRGRSCGSRCRRAVDQRVEHQLEGAMHLIAMLWTEAKQHHPPRAMFHHDGGGLLGDYLLAEQPPALQNIPLHITGDDLDVLTAVSRG